MGESIEPLGKAYEKYFRIGSCISKYSLNHQMGLLHKHFNSYTCENAMKPINLQPKPGLFNFKKADKLIEKLKDEGDKIRGHTLVWHNQIPDWFFLDESENFVKREELLERMKTHMSNVLQHYQNRVYCWDVVNEAAADGDNEQIYRKNRWYQILGEDYVEKAFKFAKEVDSEIKLFYNDYNAVVPHKRDKIYNLLQDMLAKGVPIDGMGIQGHWNLDFPSLEKLEKAFEKYTSLDLDIHITELDISVYNSDDKRTDLKSSTEEMQRKQQKRYREIFRLFREYSDCISNVTFWGAADDHTWKDDFPVEGRKDWPLLFDEKQDPKPALVDIINEA